MPRSGVNGTYNVPPGTDNQQPLTVISSAMFNAFAGDVQQTFNTPQPIAYGGTNATTPIGAMDNLMTKGTDVATAATLNLDTASGQFVDLTGTTTVTAVTLSEGRHRITRAAGNFQITVGASLIGNGGGANIAVQTGDLIFWEGYSGGVVRFWVVKGNGQSVSGAVSNDPQNLALSATVSSNALTISIKGHNGNDPSSGNPVYVPFRSATANNGDVDVLTLTAATSLVVSSGSTLGTVNATAANLIVVGFNDAGTFRLGIINPNVTQLPLLDGIASSTAEGGSGAADNAGTFYTGTAVSSKAYTVLGYVTVTQATAGTWASAPSLLQFGTAPSTAFGVGFAQNSVGDGNVVISTLGPVFEITGVSPDTKEIIIDFRGLQGSAATNLGFRLGTASGLVSSGYSGQSSRFTNAVVTGGTTTGLEIPSNQNATSIQGKIIATLLDPPSHTWSIVFQGSYETAGTTFQGSTVVQLSAPCTRVAFFASTGNVNNGARINLRQMK